MTTAEIMNKLQAPFDPAEIEWRVGSTNSDKSKGMALAYVTNRAIQNRLDEVFGIFGWQNVFREWKKDGQLCGISVLHEGEWITKWDGADDSNMEATKGGLSDAMKRAAYQWGIGRYLYKLPSVWVELEQRGKNYYIKQEPSLPKWALPEGHVLQRRNEVAATTERTTPPPPTQERLDTSPLKPDPPKKETKKETSANTISTDQNRAIRGMEDMKKIPHTDVIDYIGKEFSKDSTTLLTKDEASKVITWLNEQPKREEIAC